MNKGVKSGPLYSFNCFPFFPLYHPKIFCQMCRPNPIILLALVISINFKEMIFSCHAADQYNFGLCRER